MEAADFRTVHSIPGRMRVKIGPLRGNDDLARALEARLAGQAGVQAAEANAATGSLLVLYDPEAPGWRDPSVALSGHLSPIAPQIDREDIAEQLAVPQATPTNGTAGIEAHHVMGFFRDMNDQVRSATGGPGLTLLVPLALLLLGVRGLLAAKEVAAPRWYDFLWFGFATFLMLNAAGVPTAKAAEEAAEIAATV